MKQPEAINQPEEMDDFERALTRAMRRVEVRAETSAKLLAIAAAVEEEQRHAGRQTAPRRAWRRGRPATGPLFVLPKPAAWMGGALAAALVLVAVVAGDVEHHGRAQQRLRAERDFALSLQITNQALAQTRLQLRQAGVQLDQ